MSITEDITTIREALYALPDKTIAPAMEALDRLAASRAELVGALQSAIEVVRGSAEMPHAMPAIQKRQWDIYHAARAALSRAKGAA